MLTLQHSDIHFLLSSDLLTAEENFQLLTKDMAIW